MPENTEEPTMTAAEFRCLREFLGLTNAWLADYLGVTERSVNRWGDGVSDVPPGVVEDMLALERIAHDAVAFNASEFEARGATTWTTWRTDAALHAAHPDDPYPASWHRAIAARIRDRVFGLTLVYADAS